MLEEIVDRHIHTLIQTFAMKGFSLGLDVFSMLNKSIRANVSRVTDKFLLTAENT